MAQRIAGIAWLRVAAQEMAIDAGEFNRHAGALGYRPRGLSGYPRMAALPKSRCCICASAEPPLSW